MNAESFVQYVQQLSRLYQLPYEELKSLSMQYPYFQNLHLLLALKSKLEEHPDYPRNLAKASTYSTDRAQLYRTLTKLEKLAIEDNFLLHEEVLELQEITQLEEKLKDLELIPDPAEEVPLSHQKADTLPEVPTFVVNTESIDAIVSEEATTITDDWLEESALKKEIVTGNAPAFTPVNDTLLLDAVAVSFVFDHFHKKQIQFSQTISLVSEEQLSSEKRNIDSSLLPDAIGASFVLDSFYEQLTSTVEEDPKTEILSSNLFKHENLLLDVIAISSIMEQLHQQQPFQSPIPKAAPITITKAAPIAPLSIDLEEKAKQLKQHLKKIKKKKPKPMPKKSFSTWIEQFQPAHVKPHLGDLMEAKKKEKIDLISSKSDPSKIQGDNLNFFAQKSILENKEMASETLAEILVAQMQYQRAIKVYERLILIFPKKSAFFAGKIENLKNLIS